MFDKWITYWFPEGSLVRLAVFRMIMLVLASRTMGVVKFQVYQLAQSEPGSAGHVWNPIFAFELAGLGPPSLETAHLFGALVIVATFTGVIGLFTRTSCFLAALLYFWFWGMAYSTGQAHHEKIALMFALGALPFSPCGRRLSLDSLVRSLWRAAQRHGPLQELPSADIMAKWPLLLVQWTIAFGYGFAGCTKLARSGLEWMNGYTLQSFMLGSGAPWSSYFAQSPRLCAAMSIGLIIVQVGFPIVLFVQRSRWVMLPLAASFHLLGMMTLGAGPYDTLWVVMIAFIPLDRVPAFLAPRLRGGRVRSRVAWAIATFAPILAYCTYFLGKIGPGYQIMVVIALWTGLRGTRSRPLSNFGYDVRDKRSRILAALARSLDWNGRLRLNRELPPTGWLDCAPALPLLAPVAMIARRAEPEAPDENGVSSPNRD